MDVDNYFVPSASIRANGIVVVPRVYSIDVTDIDLAALIELIQRVELVILGVVKETEHERKIKSLLTYLRGYNPATTTVIDLFDHQLSLLIGILEYYEHVVKCQYRLYKTLGLVERAFQCIAEQSVLRILTTSLQQRRQRTNDDVANVDDVGDVAIWDTTDFFPLPF